MLPSKHFGRTREAMALTRRAELADGAEGSDAWYMVQSNLGDQLLESGQASEAAERFKAIRNALGETPSYELATTLSRLGRCYAASGCPDLAEAQYVRGITVVEAFEKRDLVKKVHSTLHADLADTLIDQGKFADAREHYAESLNLAKELKDLRGQRIAEGQLGTLDPLEDNLDEAVRRFQKVLTISRLLHEPARQALYQHRLGLVLQKAG